MKKLLVFSCLLSIFCSAMAQDVLHVVGWNIESGGMDGNTIANQIRNAQEIDIWGISEMPNSAELEALFEVAAEDGEDANFDAFRGSTGGGDRLLIIYNSDRFDLIELQELDEINIQGTGRAPLVAEFELKNTNTRFFFMVNHLFRGNATKRHSQSRMLNEWMELQSIPVIAVGDYNYDWDVVDGDTDHDEGFDLLTAGGFVYWVRPTVLVNTQCSARPDGSCRYNSVLDFVFTANFPECWESSSQILVAPNDFPDDHRTSDHRMVMGSFQFKSCEPADCGFIKEALKERITTLEAEVEKLKELLTQLEEM